MQKEETEYEKKGIEKLERSESKKKGDQEDGPDPWSLKVNQCIGEGSGKIRRKYDEVEED